MEDEGQWYISQNLLMRRRNYEIHNKEMLAVIRRLGNWRYLLKGAKIKFELWTNYKNL